jgi:hypothetical protein
VPQWRNVDLRTLRDEILPYLPPERRGTRGPLSAQQILYLRKQLMRSLVKQMPRELSVQLPQALFSDPAG